ncbi:MAG: carbohydrate ABC transporter permease [Bacillota bacterium]|nr:carbohydrate ABC transporter permease [Bacillota bacterium]
MSKIVQRQKLGGRLFDLVNFVILTLVGLACLYPMIHVIAGSLSHPEDLMRHRGLLLWPKRLFTVGYDIVFSNPNIWLGYKNTLIYVGVGTLSRTFMTMLCAYILSRDDFMPKRILTLFIVLTMYIGGGMIPNYLLIYNLKLLNTRGAIIVPTLINTWNVIILRTAFQQSPKSLEESAKLDGGGDLTILFAILAPTNIAALVVVMLSSAVAEWNSWFPASIYLPLRKDLHPLQLYLREVLIEYSSNSTAGGQVLAADLGSLGALIDDVIRYATIVLATMPILVVYPFAQKYFVKGFMLGAVKG